MNRIWEIRNQLGLKKCRNTTFPRYEGVFSTGEFDAVFDYGAGILTVMIGSTVMGKDEYVPFVSISTVDDGTWQALTPNSMPIIKSNAVVTRIAEEWEWKTKLPTAEELNKYLMDFGLWGENTG